MRIREILEVKQPEELKVLKEKAKEDKLSYLTESDIKKLMSHSCYKRGPNGAIRQIR